MTDPASLPFKVVSQGQPGVCAAWLIALYDDVALVSIVLNAKYCEPSMSTVSETGAPVLGVRFVEGSSETLVELPTFSGWSRWSMDVCKYTWRIVLVRQGGRT